MTDNTQPHPNETDEYRADPQQLTQIKTGYWVSLDKNVHVAELTAGGYVGFYASQGQYIEVGTFDTKDEAAQAANQEWDLHHG